MTDLSGCCSKLSMTFPFLAVPVILQGLSTEGGVTESKSDITTCSFDLDEEMYASYTPFEPKIITLKFKGTSPSLEYFILWENEMHLAKRALNTATLVIFMDNLGKKRKYNNGALKIGDGLPEIGSTLGDVSIEIAFHPHVEVIKL